jgi:hypothetical protein
LGRAQTQGGDQRLLLGQSRPGDNCRAAGTPPNGRHLPTSLVAAPSIERSADFGEIGALPQPPAATTITPTTASAARESTPLAESASDLAGAWRCSGPIHGPDRPAPSEVTLESSGPMGGMKIRDTETVVSSDQLKMLGEYLTDGTNWRTGYDLSCAR